MQTNLVQAMLEFSFGLAVAQTTKQQIVASITDFGGEGPFKRGEVDDTPLYNQNPPL